MFRNGWNSPGDSNSPGEFQPLRNMSPRFSMPEQPVARNLRNKR
jgi:hypothetical protein